MSPGPSRRETAPVGSRRGLRLLSVLAVLGVAGGTAAAYVGVTRDAEEAVEREAESLAAEAVASVETSVGDAVAALRGAGAVVEPDGSLDRDAFAAFASGMLGGPISAVALGVVVDGDDREAFEAVEGPILHRTPDGTFEPAPDADVHFPVVDLVAEDDTPQRAEGVDYAAEPERAETVAAARDQGSAAVSQPVRLQSRGTPGFVVVEPLYRRGAPLDTVAQRRAAFVGFVTVGYQADAVLADIRQELPAGTGLRVTDGGEPVFAVPELPEGFQASAPASVPGRTWEVTVRPAEGPATALPRTVLGAGTVAVLGLLGLFWLTGRHDRRLRRAYADRQRAQERSETLEGLASELSRSLSSVEVAESLLERLLPFTGVAAGAVLAPDDAGTRLELLAAVGYRPDDVPAIQGVELGVASAIADALRDGEPLWVSSPLSWRDDEVTAAFGAPGRSMAIVPLRAERHVVGLLVLVHAGVRTFYEEERSLLTTVGALAARALNRARRYDAEHDAAVVLQRALLPRALPERSDVRVAVRYLPASDGLAVGGDWYDVFGLPDGRLAVAVGDVVGRGVRAAAAMGQLRSACHALADVVPEPAPLLEAFVGHVRNVPDALCATMVYAVLDAGEGSIVYARAGHPPPLLVRPDGEVAVLDGGSSPPLGVSGVPAPGSATVEVGPGDALVLYTDGVVERRGEPITAGVERLRGVVAAAAGLEPDECCDRIVDGMLGGAGARDDAAVVVVRFEVDPSRPSRRITACRPRSLSSTTTR